MTNAQPKETSEELTRHIILGMQDKKGEEIVCMDLRNLGNSMSDFFVICHATSDRQVDAIADSVMETVRKKTGEKPLAVEGRNNAEWILLDFVDVVVHVFQASHRSHYALEDLWADAAIEHISE